MSIPDRERRALQGGATPAPRLRAAGPAAGRRRAPRRRRAPLEIPAAVLLAVIAILVAGGWGMVAFLAGIVLVVCLLSFLPERGHRGMVRRRARRRPRHGRR